MKIRGVRGKRTKKGVHFLVTHNNQETEKEATVGKALTSLVVNWKSCRGGAGAGNRC